MAPWLEVPYEITEVTPQEDRLIKKCILGHTSTFVRCGKQGYVMPGPFRDQAQAIYNLKVRPDDVWVITFPRSGTTWSQEMVWLLENNLDYKTAKEIPLHERFPMLEVTSIIPEIGKLLINTIDILNLGNFQGLDQAIKVPSWESIEAAPSPRFIKTHLPLSLLPPNLLETAKVMYVARDPRDVCVSYYYLHKMMGKILQRSKVKDFWEALRRDCLIWTPVVEHANEAWLKRDHPNLHFVFYEELKQDLPLQIRRVCSFLGRQYSDEQISELAQYLSFDSLRKNKSVNCKTDHERVQFIRKGEAGGWKKHFDKTMSLQAEEFLIRSLKNLDLEYPSFPRSEWPDYDDLLNKVGTTSLEDLDSMPGQLENTQFKYVFFVFGIFVLFLVLLFGSQERGAQNGF